MQGVESVLSRAMGDATFASQLFSNTDQALSGFDLTAKEIANLKGISRADFDALSAASPEARKSFGIKFNHKDVWLRARD